MSRGVRSFRGISFAAPPVRQWVMQIDVTSMAVPSTTRARDLLLDEIHLRKYQALHQRLGEVAGVPL